MGNEDPFKTTSFLQESRYFEDAKMSVLLQNTDKGEGLAGRTARRHVDPSTDLGKLDVCFGGFTPMALSDGPASSEQVLAAQQRARERKEAAERAAAVEAARASEAAEFVDDEGNVWRYVVLDGAEVRIEHCECAVADVAVPSHIDGKPVVALASEACAGMSLAESLDMPDGVVSVGYCAFRGCGNLRRIRFSKGLAKFDSGWLRACDKLERLALPGKLERLTPSVFDLPALKFLEIGACVSEATPGAFAKSRLVEISVDPASEFAATDGKALYSKDGSVMVALAVPCASYSVKEGCVAVAKKGFSNFADLREVRLPDSVEVVGDYAFSRTGISSFDAPSRLLSIGERAFFACERLVRVRLNEGLEFIGANAFTETAIEELRLPSSIVEFGSPIAAGTSLSYSGEGATFSIGEAEDAEPGRNSAGDAAHNAAEPALKGDAPIPEGFAPKQRLFLDEEGGLYRNADDGMHLVRMLEPATTAYRVKPGTVSVDEGAFAKHPSLESIEFPEGVKAVRKGAFKDCRSLVSATLPESLAVVEEEAFLGTNLASLRIPAALARIGAVALVTEGAHHGTVEPSLRHVEVAPGNPRYYVDQGLLIEHLDNGSDRIVLCTGEVPDVVVPESVTGIAQYAFNGVRRLRTLSISERVQMIDVRGIAFDCLLENIHVDLLEPFEGHASFDFEFPNTSRSAQQMRLAFGSCNFLSVPLIFDHYDNAIVSRSGFDAESEGQLGAYEQGRRIVKRLSDPVYMTPNNRGLMESSLRNHLSEICVDAARHDDKSVIEGLLDLGYIDAGNIADIIEAVGVVQDASVTNYLLEQKQRRFGAAGIDFAL